MDDSRHSWNTVPDVLVAIQEESGFSARRIVVVGRGLAAPTPTTKPSQLPHPPHKSKSRLTKDRSPRSALPARPRSSPARPPGNDHRHQRSRHHPTPLGLRSATWPDGDSPKSCTLPITKFHFGDSAFLFIRQLIGLPTKFFSFLVQTTLFEASCQSV
jgi:hypothetical protein